ncbi:MAG: aldo/keto reductase [Luteimonas sp.]
MQYRRLGTSGLQLSALSFGAWMTFGKQVGRGEARNLIAAAWDHGINFFDNAETYANGAAEEVMGDVIADLRLPRDGYCISSKVFFGAVDSPRPTQRGLSRKHVHDACHAALARLRVDYLDLFFCHRPDPDTPIVETVRAMDALIRQGKVLYWGTSEWPAAAIREAARVANSEGLQAPTMEQPQYNLLHRERVEVEYAALYDQLGLGTTIWSPLASGLLTGKYSKDIPADARLGIDANAWLRRGLLDDGDAGRIERARRFCAVADELGAAPAPLAIAWCLRNPRVSTVMLGASRVEQLLQNLQALDMPIYDDATWDRIEAATR